MSEGIRAAGLLFAAATGLLSVCAVTSGVMDTGGGTYMISAHAAPVRGGTAGASKIAYAEANSFCATYGRHAVVLAAEARDVYEGAVAAGTADLHFSCE